MRTDCNWLEVPVFVEKAVTASGQEIAIKTKTMAVDAAKILLELSSFSPVAIIKVSGPALEPLTANGTGGYNTNSVKYPYGGAALKSGTTGEPGICRKAASGSLSVLPFLYWFKDQILIPVQGRVQDHSEYPAGNDFPDSHCQHQERDRQRHLIPESQDKRYDQCVGQDRRKRRQESALTAQQVSEYSAGQGSKASENDVRHDASAQDVAEQASHEQSRNSRRGEYRKDGQRLRETYLYFSIGKWREQKGQHHINGGDHGRLCNKLHIESFCFFHCFVLL